jgi:hypothetical protein
MLKVFGNQEQMKEEFCCPERLGWRFFLLKTGRCTIQKSKLKTKKQDRTIKESELKPNRHNRPIQKSELETKKQDRTIKESELKTNRHNRPIQKSELDSTDCIVRYNWKIESVSENRSIGPFAHLWL